MAKIISVDITVNVKIKVDSTVDVDEANPDYICNEMDYNMYSTVNGTKILKTEFIDYDVVKVEEVEDDMD